MMQPWSPENVVSEKEVSFLIGRQFPQLRPVFVERIGEGFDNSVFLINNEYVFRFPRREIAAGLIETENRLLPLVAPLLSIPVPNPEFQGVPHGDYHWPFSGYRVLAGKSPGQLTLEQRMLSAEPLARFLRSLHDFPVEEAERLKVPYDELGRLDFVKRKPKLEKHILDAQKKGLLEPRLLGSLEEFLSSFDGSVRSVTSVFALVHGDLHIRNMLVNERGQISAVIDWGDTHIGHPAIDLSIVYSFLPPLGRDEFFRIYGSVPEEFKEAARFKAIYTLVLLLLFGEDQGDEGLVLGCKESLAIAVSD